MSVGALDKLIIESAIATIETVTARDLPEGSQGEADLINATNKLRSLLK